MADPRLVDASRPYSRPLAVWIWSVGNGITTLVSGAFEAIGAAVRGIYRGAEVALPGGLLFVVAVVAAGGGWLLLKP